MNAPDVGTSEALPTTAADSWNEYFGALQARYPKISTPILVALHILTQHPDITLLDAKAQAAVHGVRITAASVSAARRLLQRQTPARGAKAAGQQKSTRKTRKPQAPAAVFVSPPSGFNIEKLVRGTIESIRAEAQAESKQLRAAIRQALKILCAAADATTR